MTIIKPLLLAFALLMVPASAAEPEIEKLWPTDPPGGFEIPGPEHNASKDAMVRLTGVTDPELHVYTAAGDPAQTPVIVVAPGGGYSILAWDHEGTAVADRLVPQGVTVAVLKYRVPTRQLGEETKWVAPAMDLQRAVAMMRNRTAAPHVGVMGFSAGGHAAAHALLADRWLYEIVDQEDNPYRRPDFGVLVYPAYLLTEEVDAGPIRRGVTATLKPDLRVDEQAPPMCLIHSSDDKYPAAGSVELWRQLDAAGVDAALHIFTGAGHGFGLVDDGGSEDGWPELVTGWMRQSGWLGNVAGR